MGSTVLDIVALITNRAAAFWNWLATGSAGFPPL
ncbi:hypothetical protein FB390_5188 [Nocardia bhagyanarayanae]|uniref:Uncharacterized protein n=1 Tax=Nocardia bhagyanarayanae TaxID=1215925 RepID=A0A543FHX2_9NOCA|nr:hypothetical protein FB390_5188 [Nocardia bhagyanarayanae]